MNNKINEISSCEVCGNDNLFSVLNLGSHPMCDDLVEVNDERVCKEYPIEILFCKECLTGHQRYQVPKDDLFPSTYHYRSRFTADVLKGMENLVTATFKRFKKVQNVKVLDIGCNDGSLLDFFKNSGALTIGIEPTDAYLDAQEKGHITYNNFLSNVLAESIVSDHGNPDIITFTNVFAHIEDLGEVLSSLRILMKEDTIIVIENHYLGAVLERSQFDTFYHEHPRTYSYTSFLHMAKSIDMSVLDLEFPSRYGGNIRVFLGKEAFYEIPNIVNKELLLKKESCFFDDFHILNTNINSWLVNKAIQIDELIKKHGSIKAKAFPGRAAILIKMLKLDENLISGVYEKHGSLKIGNYLPGTRIPIYSDQDLILLDNKELPILNLAWHISKEINSYMSNIGYTGPIIDILSEQDFQPSN
jgi:hypothetical protein